MPSIKLKPFNEPIFVTRPMLPSLKDVFRELKEIWAAKWLTNSGAKLYQLEKELKKFLDIDNISLMCNGTQALELAIKALGLKGEVITTPFTFPATSHALMNNGIKPVYCDIEENFFNLDPEKIESLITKKTTAILPVHVYGNPADVRKIDVIAKKHGLKVLYDAAHAFGVKINGEPIGRFGDAAVFSFHATKVFHTIEGGAVVTNDPQITEKINYLKNFGITHNPIFHIKNVEVQILAAGTNAKMNELQAAIGLTALRILDQEIAKRKMVARQYRMSLAEIPGIRFLNDQKGIKHSYIYFPITVNEKEYGVSRDHLFVALKKYNVFARKYFHPLTTEYAGYEKGSWRAGRLPVAQKAADEILCLPLYGELKPNQAAQICKIIEAIPRL